MSEWLLSEHQSICVCCDRMSAPMPCVLLTQCYGFFILSNQWYMKQHRHIWTIDLFLHTYHRSPRFLVMQPLWCSGLNKQFTFFVAFSLAVWIQAEFNINGKQAIKSVLRVIQINENTCLLSVDLLNSGGSETGAFCCTVLAIFEKRKKKALL